MKRKASTKSQRVYIALTIESAREVGYSIVYIGAEGESKFDVENEAERRLGREAHELQLVTRLKNLRVMTWSQTEKRMGTNDFQSALDEYDCDRGYDYLYTEKYRR